VYEIKLSENFSEQLKKLYSDHPRTDELIKAISWLLSHNPRMALILEDNVFLWVTEQLPVKTIPKVKIIYSVQETRKTVLLISIAEYVDPKFH
jgi:mRNA-degrading endonuclease RelE of RelBE toxin-antitoxin system